MADSVSSNAASFPILVVDDDLFIRRILEASLKTAGYDVVTAGNGKEALEIFRTGYYPIVMTDWVMPEMSGIDLCRAIRQEDSEGYTYIILLTSNDSKNDIIAGLDAGADEYLIKPAHPVELATRLKTAKRILALESSLKNSIEEIKNLSLIDQVTGVYNRRYMDNRISQEIKRAYRYKRPLALMLVHISHYGFVTETYGHYSGDLVLKSCADCLVEAVRKDIDWLGRFAENTFVVLLPETDVAGAMILAKRLRIRIATMSVRLNEQEVRGNACFGVASFIPGEMGVEVTAQNLLENADRCLYQAIGEGSDVIKGCQFG